MKSAVFKKRVSTNSSGKEVIVQKESTVKFRQTFLYLKEKKQKMEFDNSSSIGKGKDDNSSDTQKARRKSKFLVYLDKMEEYPELIRFNKMQNLSVKLVSNFE